MMEVKLPKNDNENNVNTSSISDGTMVTPEKINKIVIPIAVVLAVLMIIGLVACLIYLIHENNLDPQVKEIRKFLASEGTKDFYSANNKTYVNDNLMSDFVVRTNPILVNSRGINIAYVLLRTTYIQTGSAIKIDIR